MWEDLLGARQQCWGWMWDGSTWLWLICSQSCGSWSKSWFTSFPSTVGKGNGSSPSANSIPEMDWFSKGKALAQPVNLWDIWMLMLQRNKNQGTNWEWFVSWPRGCCSQGLLPGSTSNFSWYNNLLPTSRGRVSCILWQYHLFAELLKIKID